MYTSTYMHMYICNVSVDLQTAVSSCAVTVISVVVLMAPSYTTAHTSKAPASSDVM